MIRASSKWQFPNGTHEMRDAVVKDYDIENEQYVIEWPNGTSKRVSRFNICFKNEDPVALKFRIAEATRLREQAEYFLKYRLLIDTVDTEPGEFTDERKVRIAHYLHSHQFNY